jgi:dolichyl-phosphate beta-glucosyltransferase
VRRGFARARGEIQLFMDGDFPFELTVIERMIVIFREAELDMVIGDRTLAASVYPKELPVMRKIGSNILSMFAGHVFTPGYFDTQCGVKGFRKAAAGELFPYMVIDGFSFDMEILYVALKRKYRIGRVPVEAKEQEASHVRVGRHGLEMLANLFRISFNQVRGKYNQARGRHRS